MTYDEIRKQYLDDLVRKNMEKHEKYKRDLELYEQRRKYDEGVQASQRYAKLCFGS